MITSIDFGCHFIRSAYRQTDPHHRVVLTEERSEYIVIPTTAQSRKALTDAKTPFAECEQKLLVYGNHATDVMWLSQQPATPLFADGQVPRHDPPARQILSILTDAMLRSAKDDGAPEICCFTSPGGRAAGDNVEFLSRLIRMQGMIPMHCSAAVATMLASGHESGFTGVSVVLGAESCEISVCRYGLEIAAETIPVGADWVDTEFARQTRMQIWDRNGDCYLDLQAVRDWKHDPSIHLRDCTDEKQKILSRLYGVLLDRISDSLHRLIASPQVQAEIGRDRMAVYCAGGPTLVPGFAGAFTERLVERDTAPRLESVRVIHDAEHVVVRGLLIQAELELRRNGVNRQAA